MQNAFDGVTRPCFDRRRCASRRAVPWERWSERWPQAPGACAIEPRLTVVNIVVDQESNIHLQGDRRRSVVGDEALLTMTDYRLPGNKEYQESLFPCPSLLDPETRQKESLEEPADVIRHFVASSLVEDGIGTKADSLRVALIDNNQGYRISFQPLPGFEEQAEAFAAMHQRILAADHYGLGLRGAEACRRTPAWNPMAPHPVNASDGPCEWIPYLPLGMPLVNHRAVVLMHYPPIVAYRKADYLNNMTLRRWALLLSCAGVETSSHYHSILDVNPIAAPGSGQSEYANDYFPISLTSQFFDNEAEGLTYVRTMLELMLNPPWNRDSPCTLPLLVCGSPLYDPQAVGWFRVRYKDVLPTNNHGTPQANALQVGFISIFDSSEKPTPYMIGNHMIAAGVTGSCDGKPDRLPNIRTYEAQDLVAASWLHTYYEQTQEGETFDPVNARSQACLRWFGNPHGIGAPKPEKRGDMETICALAQMDLCFDSKRIAPMYSYEEALQRCRQRGGDDLSPCFGCAPLAG